MFGILQMELDFAAMQKADPSLLTLKDFVMSSNQAPNSPDDILSLLQAFAEFKQGADSLCLCCASSASSPHIEMLACNCWPATRHKQHNI